MTRATEALRQTETSLRDLVLKAAAAGDYAGVVQIASWASMINKLIVPCEPGGSGTSLIAAVPRKTKRRPARTSGAKERRRRGHAIRNDYPRFFRRGQQLVRVAWSRQEKKEYQHKTSHKVVEALVGAMAKIGADGRVFSTEEFLPIEDADGNPVPSYQAYVCIALFKHTGLIDQHGRQGYSIPRLAEFKDTVESLWQKLPEYKPTSEVR